MEKSMKVNMLTADLELLEKKFEIESIKLIDIFQIVGHRHEQAGYNALFDDIAENGFKNPIIVIPNNQYNYDLALRQVKSKYVNKWEYFRRWICMYGNQRMDIALKLGIYTLETVITPNVEWAHAAHLKLNGAHVSKL